MWDIYLIILPRIGYEVIYPVLLAVYLFCFGHSLKIMAIESCSRFEEVCLDVSHLLTPFMFFVLCKTSDFFHKECYLSCIQENLGEVYHHVSFSRGFIVGIMVYLVFFLPLCKLLEARLRELPREE